VSIQTGYGRGAAGYHAGMGLEDGSRNIEQKLASGRSEKTPVLALGSVIVVIAALVAVAVAFAALAYFLA
jgi:hypothetical protein